MSMLRSAVPPPSGFGLCFLPGMSVNSVSPVSACRPTGRFTFPPSQTVYKLNARSIRSGFRQLCRRYGSYDFISFVQGFVFEVYDFCLSRRLVFLVFRRRHSNMVFPAGTSCCTARVIPDHATESIIMGHVSLMLIGAQQAPSRIL